MRKKVSQKTGLIDLLGMTPGTGCSQLSGGCVWPLGM